MDYDAIIIGTGIGGLISGAKLVKEGKKVLLIEQESTPGGYASCLNISDEYMIDFGLHAMDGLYEKDPKVEVFEDLDIFFNIEFEKITTGFYKFYNERKDFTLPDNEEEIIEKLIEWFPEEEEKSIKRFFKIINAPKISKWGEKTAGDLLDEHFKNEDLKLALVGNIQYYGDDPYKLSAITYATAISSRFKGGSHYIKGGSIKFSYGLVNFIKQHGGTFLFDRLVTRIKVERGKAYGVEYTSKGGSEKKVHDINGKIIIANAPVPQVVNELLQGKSHSKFKEQINKLDVGHSVLNIYLGFNKKPIEIGNTSYTTVVNDPSIIGLKQIADNHKGDYKKRNYIFVDYSQIDSMLAPSGKSIGVISAVDYIENWAGLSKAEYKTKKKEVAHIFIDRLYNIIPDIVGHVDFYYVSTPRTKVEYTLNPNGTFLGFANTVNQSGMKRLQNKSPIKNLYFASAWTFPGGGYSSTIISGWQCAKEVLKKL
ncbi:MAG: NAD(P)/FAD-dependent oxidoreductase [Candidatus Heimdallarchaeota archaeon]|nr:NAD(P)/FAD-dependent oxidoreductase [Candidatus Heimdallarchaeota archaeon]MCK4877183.1 NAD(P)/FAD-dependent oxidoreductase [Candidatus Heimdallarchaeota archaeon]